MSRYIDADALYQTIDAWRKKLVLTYGEVDDYVECLGDVLDIIEDAPTVEEKNGRWLNKGRKICCSVCGRTNFAAPNFCPNCGADMREEKEDD